MRYIEVPTNKMLHGKVLVYEECVNEVHWGTDQRGTFPRDIINPLCI